MILNKGKEKMEYRSIRDLLEKAAKADPTYQVFGAGKHKYQLNPPVSLEEVCAFEEEFQIKLPEEYVHFLTEIGNGGAGPYYGLYSLEELRQQQYYRQQNDGQAPVIDANLTKEKWNELMELMDTDDDDVYDEIERQIHTGILIIGTQGCTFDNLLMCKGSEAGKIVYIDWNLEIDYPPFLTKMSFLEWYTGFFEDIIAGFGVQRYGYCKRCAETELIEAYKKAVTLEDKLENLQGLMRFDKLSAETIDFLYDTQDAQTDDARLSVLLKYQPDLGMELFDRLINGVNVPAAAFVLRRIPKEVQQKYYRRAVEILYGESGCDKKRVLFFISDQEQKKAADLIEFATGPNVDEELLSVAIYVIGKCEDAMNYEDCFIAWMRGENYRIAHSALQAAISTNHRSPALMETFQWMAEKYKKDSVMRNNLRKVIL